MSKPQNRKLVAQKVGAVDKRRRPRGLTRAVRTALDAIIFDRCTRAEACKRAGLTERALYLALEKPEVARYWNGQLDVLRTGERAGSIHALVRVRDGADGKGGSNQMAVVNAVKTLEQLDAAEASNPIRSTTMPGLVIQIVNQAPARAPMIDVAPIGQVETVDEEPASDGGKPFDSEEPFVPGTRLLAPRDMAPAPKQRWER